LNDNLSTSKTQVHVSLGIKISIHITSISNKTTENNDDRGRQYQIVICFRDLGSPRAFVSELFPITRINHDLFWR